MADSDWKVQLTKLLIQLAGGDALWLLKASDAVSKKEEFTQRLILELPNTQEARKFVDALIGWSAHEAQPAGMQQPLPPIPEDQVVTKNMLDHMLDQRLDEMYKKLRVLDGHRGSMSASQMGKLIADNCITKGLVAINGKHRQQAREWVTRAGKAGQAFQAATLSTSTLSESGPEGVQSIFTKLLAHHNPKETAGPYTLHDVHTETSVCGTLKPDTVVAVGKHKPLPNNTAMIVELKGQDVNYCSHEHIYQVTQYAISVLEQLPVERRKSILVALTDLKAIRFLRVTRSDDGSGYTYEQTEELAEVLPALCAALCMSPTELQAGALPDVRYQGQPLTLQRLLGAGRTATVYQSSVSQGVVAVKLLEPQFTAAAEMSVLEELEAGGCAGVPKVVGVLDSPAQGLLLQPIGTVLDSRHLAQYPTLFKALKPLVMTLKHAHGLGWAHRDVRKGNLLLVLSSATDVSIRLSDWGFAVLLGSEVDATSFAGTARCASTTLLLGLAQAQAQAQRGHRDAPLLIAMPGDDLESLVKTLFLLSHPVEAVRIHMVRQGDYASLLAAWEDLFSRHPWWAELQKDAAAADYETVGSKLTQRFD